MPEPNRFHESRAGDDGREGGGVAAWLAGWLAGCVGVVDWVVRDGWVWSHMRCPIVHSCVTHAHALPLCFLPPRTLHACTQHLYHHIDDEENKVWPQFCALPGVDADLLSHLGKKFEGAKAHAVTRWGGGAGGGAGGGGQAWGSGGRAGGSACCGVCGVGREVGGTGGRERLEDCCVWAGQYRSLGVAQEGASMSCC